MLIYFVAIWYNLQPFGIVCGNLVIFSGFGIMYQEKSGNPDHNVNGSYSWRAPEKNVAVESAQLGIAVFFSLCAYLHTH
jgi:hypothetical protein